MCGLISLSCLRVKFDGFGAQEISQDLALNPTQSLPSSLTFSIYAWPYLGMFSPPFLVKNVDLLKLTYVLTFDPLCETNGHLLGTDFAGFWSFSMADFVLFYALGRAENVGWVVGGEGKGSIFLWFSISFYHVKPLVFLCLVWFIQSVIVRCSL